MSTRPARLGIGVVSAGRVGSVLGAAWSLAGHRVVATSGVSRASVRRAAELLPQVPLLSPDEVVARADLAVLAVPDDVLPGLVRGLVAAGAFRAGQIVVHTSGAHGVAVLDPAAESGVLPLALHPVMTFTGRNEDVARLAGCAVGGCDADGTSGEPGRVAEPLRPLYHAALAHGANHLVTLVRDCAETLERAGIGPAERLIAPLLSAALDNALRHGDRALTGPVSRGDSETVRTHLRELHAIDPELEDTYRVLARRTARRAAKAGLLPDHLAHEVLTTLEDPP